MLGINYKIQFYYCKIDFKIEIVNNKLHKGNSIYLV
jgi:hypothetical protein